ncbi:MAG: CotH kinase family protein [Prevotella sp.]|nr:CotH kinase family protein [Prevotella sp.]
MISFLLSAIVVINELMAANVGDVISPAINFDSWIELYNPSDEDVSVVGMYLSDDVNNLKRWEIPHGTVPAKGYLVLWLGSDQIDDWQAPFKLDCDGGTICLSDASGNLIASEDYPKAISHTAYARKTDGGDEWDWTATPTPGETNATAKFANQQLAAPKVSDGSKLFTGSLNISVDIPAGAHLMYTTDGSLPSAPVDPGTVASPWKEYVVNGNCEGSQTASLSYRDPDHSKDVTDITDGVGFKNTRGIKVHSTSTAKNDYDAQFFVYTPNHIWHTGEKYRFHMMVRADKASKITTQTHTTPHNWIANNMFDGKDINVTTEWKEFSFEGTITDDQVGKSGGGWSWWGEEPVTYKDMQTIAFNLNVEKADNNFYFDEVSWEYDITSGESDMTEESIDGKFTIKQTTNLVFRLYQDGYLPSAPVTRSYIQTSDNYTLPVVSIVGDKKFFTDPKIGLDCDGDGTNGITGNGQNSPKNYNCDWDRPVNFSYITTDGEMAFNQDVNISVSGGWTRSQRFRSFKLKSSKIFDGQNRFDYSFFPQKPYTRNKVVLLRNGGNDVWSNNARFTDAALETVVQRSGMDVDVQSCQPVIEYVNGELRGVFNMREPNNDKYAYANFGYDDEELDAFENEEFKNGDEEALERIYELGAKINDSKAYEELKTLLDIDEYTNYMAVTLFLFNDDWPNNNIKGYRSRKDGRYRFVSFDLDYAFGKCYNNGGTNQDAFSYFNKFKSSGLNHEFVNFFINLLKHDGYRQKFIDTFCLVAGSVFESNRANTIVQELLDGVKPMTELMLKKGISDGHNPERAADEIKKHLKSRSDKMTDYLKKYEPMQLSSVNRQSVTLKADTEGARLFVNDTEVPYADFNGHLFAPVKLKAQAPAGYQFAGWKKGSETISTNTVIDLPTGNNLNLTATFTKAAESVNPVRINEVSAANGIFVNDYWKRDDWVELYNTTDAAIDVEGMYLSDDLEDPMKYQITKGETQTTTVIPAHGHLVIWCDKESPKSQLHASFKLASEGGDMLLTAKDESWNDQFTYPTLNSDQSAGRWPDGNNDVFVMNVPTIASPNLYSSYLTVVPQSGHSGIEDLTADDGNMTVTYMAGQLVINGLSNSNVQVLIHNLAGQTVASQTTTLTGGYAEVSLSSLSNGVYVAVVTDGRGHKTSCKFVLTSK